MAMRAEAEAKWPDLAGRLDHDDGQVCHVLPVRVYFEDTDFSGVVYHGAYVRWCERGRSDYLRLLGNSHRGLLDGSEGQPPGAFVVRTMSLDFRKPAQIDDVLEVRTQATEIGAATIDLKQTIFRENQVICAVDVKVVLISNAGKPMRLAAALRSAFGNTTR